MFKQKKKVLRIIDASLNRASEGLRVVEDYARFILDDSYISARCKQLRHDLAECVQDEAFDGLVTMRESASDVGRSIATEAEYKRADIKEVVTANLARTQQATRSLEEYSKGLDLGVAKRFEQIRYLTYQLESSLAAMRIGQDRLDKSLLYVLADATSSDAEFRRRIAAIIRPRAGHCSTVDIVQLRDKNVTTQVLLDRCRAFREVAHNLSEESATLLIVNDRPDIASVARADGVHLGQDDMAIHEARTIVGPDILIGVSSHNLDQAKMAIDAGANYIGVGPTFASETKSFSEFAGLELLRSVSELTTLPAFAIGGINEDNVDEVIDAGFQRVAVSAAVWRAANPAEAAIRLRTKLTFQLTTTGDGQ